ncbi:MAG: hypothetical protein CVU81_01320 [Euryarchaeota archaeon HGW-Euryarchaeota-1]|nr:MAG: hypothetical protein CVU81_01320 [Euryarchaeota archaeon HGW-Euryarchaeota-1]
MMYDFKVYYSDDIGKAIKTAETLGLKGVCVVFHKENMRESLNFKVNTALHILKGVEIEINSQKDIQNSNALEEFDLIFAKIKNENLALDTLKSRKIQIVNFDDVSVEQSYLRLAKDTNKAIEICFKGLRNNRQSIKKYKKIAEITKRKHFATNILFTSGATSWNELLGKEEARAICSVLLKMNLSQAKAAVYCKNLLNQCDKNYLAEGVEIIE